MQWQQVMIVHQVSVKIMSAVKQFSKQNVDESLKNAKAKNLNVL